MTAGTNVDSIFQKLSEDTDNKHSNLTWNV